MDLENYISPPIEIIALHNEIRNISNNPNNQITNEVHDSLLNKLSAIKKYFNDFKKTNYKKSKNYSDNHIAHQIFYYQIKTKDLPQNLKYRFFALEKTFHRIEESIKCCFKHKYVDEYFKQVNFLDRLIYDSILLIEQINIIVLKINKYFGWGTRRIAFSYETYIAARSILFQLGNRKRYLDSHVISPTAIFLLRQSIELRLKNSLGINLIKSNDGAIQRISGDKLIDLFKKFKKKINIPIDISLIEKIHNWTNAYIHGGLIPEYFLIEWGLHILNPLFSHGKNKGYWSIFGSIKIEKSFFDNELENEIFLALQLDPKKYKILKLNSPECLLV